MEVKTLVTRLASLPMALEGLTVSGGDPMDQPRGLAELLRGVRARLPHWDVLVYSGFLLAELLADADQAEAAREVDVLVDGPYEREIPPVHPLAGSGNQQVHALSEAGRRMAARMREPAAAFNLAVACGGDGPGARQPQMLIGVSTPAKRRAAHDVLGLSGRVRDRDPK